MIEELKEEKLVEKVGGRFRLTSLIQKQLVYLNSAKNKKDKPFADAENKGKLQIAINEILEDKIYLNMDGDVVKNVEELRSNEEISGVEFNRDAF